MFTPEQINSAEDECAKQDLLDSFNLSATKKQENDTLESSDDTLTITELFSKMTIVKPENLITYENFPIFDQTTTIEDLRDHISEKFYHSCVLDDDLALLDFVIENLNVYALKQIVSIMKPKTRYVSQVNIKKVETQDINIIANLVMNIFSNSYRHDNIEIEFVKQTTVQTKDQARIPAIQIKYKKPIFVFGSISKNNTKHKYKSAKLLNIQTLKDLLATALSCAEMPTFSFDLTLSAAKSIKILPVKSTTSKLEITYENYDKNFLATIDSLYITKLNGTFGMKAYVIGCVKADMDSLNN